MERQEKNNPLAKRIAATILIIGILLIIIGALGQGKEWTGIVQRTFSTLGIVLVISALVTLVVS